MQRGPIGPLCMSVAEIVVRLPGGNFAGVRINGLAGGLVVRPRGGEFAAARGLRQPITLAVHRQDVDMVGQPVEKRAGQALGAEHRCPFLEWKIRRDDGRATFVTLAEHLEQKLGAGRRERHIAEFIDDQQLYRGQVALELQQPPLVARLHELMHQTGRRREGDREALLAGRQSEAQPNVTLPVPELPSAMMLSRRRMYSQRASSSTSILLRLGMAVKSNVSRLFTAGKRAANASFDDPPLAIDEFEFDQSQQIAGDRSPRARPPWPPCRTRAELSAA